MLEKLLLAGAFVAGLMTGLGLFSLYDGLIDDPAVSRVAREAGAQAERGLWQKEKRDAEAAAERRRAEAQSKLNAADRALAEFRANERRRSEAISRAYEEHADEIRTNSKPGCDYSQCDLPEWVRKELR